MSFYEEPDGDLGPVFRESVGDEYFINPTVDIDQSTLASAHHGDPALTDALLPYGKGFFRLEPNMRKHGLTDLQLAVSDPHNPQLKTATFRLFTEAEALQRVKNKEPVEVGFSTYRGHRVPYYFIRENLPTKDEAAEKLSKLSPTAREAMNVRFGTRPNTDELLNRQPFQGRPGMVIASEAWSYTGTAIDDLDVATLFAAEDLFQRYDAGESHLLPALKQLAACWKISVSAAKLAVERRAKSLRWRKEVLDGKDEGPLSQPVVDTTFPEPEPTMLPERFDVLRDFKIAWSYAKHPDLARHCPSLSELKDALPFEVSRKLTWPLRGKNMDALPPSSLRSFMVWYRYVQGAFKALQAYDAERQEAWQAQTSAKWETLGHAIQNISTKMSGPAIEFQEAELDFDLAAEPEEYGELDLPDYITSEVSVRPRQGLLSQPRAETDDEVKFGDLTLRISREVTTPRDNLIFMGEAGPFAPQVPWGSFNEEDTSGLNGHLRGHPMAPKMAKLLEVAQQRRDSLQIRICQPSFEVQQVPVRAYLFGRHPDFQASRPIRLTLRNLQVEFACIKRAIRKERKIPLATETIQSLDQHLEGLREQFRALKAALPEAVGREKALAAKTKDGYRHENPVVQKAIRGEDNNLIQIPVRLVGAEWGWNKYANKPQLIQGEHWFYPGKMTEEEMRKNLDQFILVHVYPAVLLETGYQVSLWGVDDQGKVYIRRKNDPLLAKYGPSGPQPQQNVDFPSRFAAEVERFCLSTIPAVSREGITYLDAEEAFPVACRWAKQLGELYGEGFENQTLVSDAFTAFRNVTSFGEQKIVPVVTPWRQISGVTPEPSDPEEAEIWDTMPVKTVKNLDVTTDDLFHAVHCELAEFQRVSLNEILELNNSEIERWTTMLEHAYVHIRENPKWATMRDEETNSSWFDKNLGAGGRVNRFLQNLAENPKIPGDETNAPLFWRAMGYLGAKNPISFVGQMMVDALKHTNPGVAGWRMTEKGRRWVRGGPQFNPGKYGQGPIGTLVDAIQKATWPIPGLGVLTPLPSFESGEAEIDQANHLRALVGGFGKKFLTRTDYKKLKELQEIARLPANFYGGFNKDWKRIWGVMKQLHQILNFQTLEGDIEAQIVQVWNTRPDLHKEIRKALLSDRGFKEYGLRLINLEARIPELLVF